MRRVKQLASDMVELCQGYQPAEYQAALTLATAIYFKAMFAHDLEQTFKLHVENLRAAIEELDARPTLDLSGIDLGEVGS